MDLRRFEALSFDCYGTLIDWEAGILGVLGPIARRKQAGLTDDDLLRAFGKAEGEVEAANPAALLGRPPRVSAANGRGTFL